MVLASCIVSGSSMAGPSRSSGVYLRTPASGTCVSGCRALLVQAHWSGQTWRSRFCHFERDPRTSTRRAAAAFNVNHMIVWRTLRSDGLHPYHFSRLQELTPADFGPRVTFCEWYRSRMEEDASFGENVLWTDEASFTNLHNEHVWAHVNPHAASQSNFQHQWRINVWAGILGDRILGPKFLPSSLNADRYLEY